MREETPNAPRETAPCESGHPPGEAPPAPRGEPAEATLLKLTEAQCRAVDAAAGRPLTLVDPRGGAEFVLLSADEHARLLKAAAALVEVRLEAEWLARTHGRSC